MATDLLAQKKQPSNLLKKRPVDLLAGKKNNAQSKTPFALAGPVSGDIEGMAEILPMAGAGVGTALGGIPGMLAGNTIGELGKQGMRSLAGTRKSEPRKLLGFGLQAPGIVNDLVASTGGALAGEGAFRAGGAMMKPVARALSPLAKKAAVSIVERMIKPTGEYATGNLGQKGSEIAENLLKENLVRGGNREIITKASEKSKELLNQIKGYLEEFANRRVKPDDALSYADEVIAKQAGPAADSPMAERLRNVKQNIIESHDLKSPVYQDVEKGQFVMKGGKQTSPKMRKINTRKIPAEAKKKALKKNKEGGFFGMAGERRVVSPKNFVENPEDIVALHKPGKPMTVVSPKETYQIRGDIKGPSIKERVKVGEKNNPLPVGKAQEYKQAQYQKVGESGFGEMASPEKELRKGVARGYKEGIEKAIPERPIKETNQRIGNLAEAIDVLAHRLGVEKRLNIASFPDLVLAGQANPASWGILAAKRALGWQPTQSAIARKLYSVGEPVKNASKSIARRLLAQEGGRRLLGAN